VPVITATAFNVCVKLAKADSNLSTNAPTEDTNVESIVSNRLHVLHIGQFHKCFFSLLSFLKHDRLHYHLIHNERHQGMLEN
jgi:hypothetical protein